MKAALLLVALLAVAAQAADPSLTIYPCRGIGWIAIGTDGPWLVGVWGRPRPQYPWVFFDDRGLAVRGVHLSQNPGESGRWVGRVEAMAVYARKRLYETERGIRFGSSLAEVVRVYGNAEVVKFKQDAASYLANQQGIMVEYESECNIPDGLGFLQRRGGIRFLLDGPPQQERVTTIIVF